MSTIVKVDEKYQPIPGSEREIPCDLVLLSIGLTPDTTLLSQVGAKMAWIPELGGLVAYRTKYQETTVPGVFVAGDASGIEEATTAILEGRIAGLSAVIRTKGKIENAVKERENYIKFLEEYRKSPLLARSREGIKKVLIE